MSCIFSEFSTVRCFLRCVNKESFYYIPSCVCRGFSEAVEVPIIMHQLSRRAADLQTQRPMDTRLRLRPVLPIRTATRIRVGTQLEKQTTSEIARKNHASLSQVGLWRPKFEFRIAVRKPCHKRYRFESRGLAS